MNQVFHFAELDEQTQSYLLKARNNEGRGVPGLYLLMPNHLPVIGAILGLGLIIFAFWLTVPSDERPIRTTLWQMVFLLPGAWMVIAALRVGLASGSTSRPGHFLYVDPAFLYQSKGYQVKVTRIQEMTSVDAEDHYNNDQYTGTTFTLNLPNRIKEQLVIRDGTQAEQFMRFLETALSLRDRNPRPSLSAIGSGARRVALNASQANDNHASAASDGETPEPPVPRAGGLAPSGMLAYLAIIAAAIAGIFLLNPLNASWRDDALFEAVRDMPANDKPHGLRLYLLDPRTERHRKEAEQMLASIYTGPAQSIQTQAKDADLGKGMATIVTGLGKALQPLVSVRVKEEKDPALEGPFFTTEEASKRETGLSKRLASTLSRVLTKDLVGIVEVTKADLPVMIDIRYKLTPAGEKADQVELTWTVTLRDRPESEPVVSKTLLGRTGQRDAFFDGISGDMGQLMLALTGQDHLPEDTRAK